MNEKILRRGQKLTRDCFAFLVASLRLRTFPVFPQITGKSTKRKKEYRLNIFEFVAEFLQPFFVSSFFPSQLLQLSHRQILSDGEGLRQEEERESKTHFWDIADFSSRSKASSFSSFFSLASRSTYGQKNALCFFFGQEMSDLLGAEFKEVCFVHQHLALLGILLRR